MPGRKSVLAKAAVEVADSVSESDHSILKQNVTGGHVSNFFFN